MHHRAQHGLGFEWKFVRDDSLLIFTGNSLTPYQVALFVDLLTCLECKAGNVMFPLA